MNKEKPTLNQEVFVLFNGELYTGKVFEIWDTPLAHPINFTFNVIIENQTYVPPSEFCLGGIRREFVVSVCSRQFNPHPLIDIYWPNGQNFMFHPAFVFDSKEKYDKHIIDTRRLKREYHLQQVELYK